MGMVYTHTYLHASSYEHTETHAHLHDPHFDLDCTDSKTIFYMTFWLTLICHVHTKFGYKRLNHKPLESFVNETTHGPKVSQMTK